MPSVVYFLSSLFFYNIYLNYEQDRNRDAALENLANFSNDLVSIGFPYEVDLSYTFVSITISVLISVLMSFSLNSKKYSSFPKGISEFINYFFINCGILFAALYLLRFFNFSRLYLIINITLFPFYMLFINFVQSRKKIISILLFILLITSNFLFLRSTSNSDSINVQINNDTEILISENIVGFLYEDEGSCNNWIGSDNYNGCSTGTKYSVLDSLGKRTSNLLMKDGDLFVLTSVGEVYVYKFSNSTYEKELFLDLRDKVFYDEKFFESGLFSMAFHPNEDYFLVSYSNMENNLAIEKFFYDGDKVDLDSSEYLLKIPSNDCCHYSGNIIWSEYFQDFLISVGDMGNQFNSTDTTSPKGKILLLNKSNFINNIPLISDDDDNKVIENIIAFGLRNPWKTYEYNGKLFIPDIGFNDFEELNIIDLDKITSPPFLGWPIYEGNYDRGEEFFPQFYFDNGNGINLKVYAEEFAYSPSVFYDHNTETVYRGALIGGGVVSDTTSRYDNNYIFADYVSKELFAYDFINDSLVLLPLPDEFNSYISSLIVNQNKTNTILVTTGVGDIVEIELP